VKASEYAASAAVHSGDPNRWWTEFSAVIDRIAPRFRPLRTAAPCQRVDAGDWSWAWIARIAGRSPSIRGDATPDGLQHLLARAKWDADEVRDDLRDYVVDAFGDPGAILVVDESGDVKG